MHYRGRGVKLEIHPSSQRAHAVTHTVRPATAADAQALADLRYEFRAGQAPVNEAKADFLTRCAAWMRARLEHPGAWRCWVWERGGAIEGHVWLQLVEKIPNPVDEPEYHAYMTNAYVRPRARGGAGSELLAAALAWCRANAVDQVILWATERSRTLYARHGFEIRADIMALTLRSVATRGRALDRRDPRGRNTT